MDVNDTNYNVALGAQMLSQEPQPTEQDAIQANAASFVDQEIRDMILKRKEASRTFFQDKKDIWDQCWNHYKQVYDNTNKAAWQSTVFIPISPKVTEVIVSNMHAALLAPDHPVEYQERQPEYQATVRDINDLLMVDMEKSQFKVHWTDILRSVGIIGTGIGKIEYVKEYADVEVKERIQENPMMARMRSIVGLPPGPTESISTKRMIVKDYASIKYVDRYDCYPEPGTVEISKDRWFIERGKICNYKLIELSKLEENPLVNVTDDLLMSNPSTVDDPDGDKQQRDAALGELNKATAYMDPDQEHELLEYWGPAPLWMVDVSAYGDESKKYEMVHAWFWLIDGQHIVRRQRTPWRDAEPPYIKSVYIRVPGQFDGVGPLELCKGLQIEVNEGVNCRQDEINLKLNAPTAVMKDMVPSGEWGRLKMGPGAIWPFTNTDDVRKAMQKIELDGNLQNSWQSTAFFMQEVEEVTAAVKATVGAGGSSGEAGGGTFRGQLLNKQVASERFVMYARLMESTGLAKSVRKMYHRIYQFKGFEEIAKILGEKRMTQFQLPSPEDLDMIAKMVPLGVTSMENKGVQLAQMIEEFKTFVQFPWFKQLEAARKIVIQRGQSDPDTILFSDEELKSFNEQKRVLMGEGMSPASVSPEIPGGTPPSPIAGNVPGPTDGLPQPAMPARGPGASSIDGAGVPL